MKKTIYFLTTTLFVSGIILNSCKSSSEKVENAGENVSDAKQDLTKAEINYTDAIQAFRKETADKIAVNDQKIAELKAKIENEKKSAREEHKKRIAELKQKNEDMKKRMDKYQDNGKEGWESFKREFDHDMDGLGKALNDLTVNNSK